MYSSLNFSLATTAILFGLLCSGIHGQDDQSNILVSTSQCSAEDVCTCTVNTPAPCDVDYEYQAILTAQASLANVKAHLNGEIVESISVRVNLLLARMSTLETSLHNQSVSLTITELGNLQEQVAILQATLADLDGQQNGTVTAQLQAEVASIQSILYLLISKNPVAVRADLTLEIAALKARLSSCTTVTQIHGEEGLDFLGDGLPFNYTLTIGHCPARPENITIGEPKTYKFQDGVTGSWFKDPMPISDAEKKRIYEIQGYSNTNFKLSYWNSLEDFESESFVSLKKQSTCVFNNYGTKPVYLHGYLYWYDGYRNQNRIRKMKMSPTCDTTTLAYSVPHPTTSHRYIGNTQTTVDLNYDETGLYSIYPDARGDLIINKLDPQNLSILQSWNTGKRKASISSLFMICGRVYSMDENNSRRLSGKQWGYDTTTEEEFFHELDIESKYSLLQQMSYNPREKVLFSWDNQHAVVYPVYF